MMRKFEVILGKNWNDSCVVTQDGCIWCLKTEKLRPVKECDGCDIRNHCWG
jgi:hypothetical protein